MPRWKQRRNKNVLFESYKEKFKRQGGWARMPPISNDWLVPLKPEFSKPYYAKLYQKVNEEYKTQVI